MKAIRIGDTIIDRSMLRSYEVTEHDGEDVKATDGRREKTFKLRDLECMDHDDGLWQEMER